MAKDRQATSERLLVEQISMLEHKAPSLADGVYTLPDGRTLTKKENIYRLYNSRKPWHGATVFSHQFLFTSKSREARKLKEVVKDLIASIK